MIAFSRLMIHIIVISTDPDTYATATATNPDTPRVFASTTEPNTVAIVNAVSENGSFINACNLSVAAATANPTAAPPANT